MRMHTAAGTSRWPFVIVGGVATVAIVGGVAFAATRPDDEQVAAPTTSAPASTAPTAAPTGDTSGAGDNEDDVPPTGCLGGQERNADMVLTAQSEAKHSTYGAVEVATAFYRFLWQYPYPADAEANAVTDNLMSSSSPASFRDLPAAYEAAGDNMAAGTVDAGAPFHISTTNGLWRVLEESTGDRVFVELAEGYVVDGALSPALSTVAGYIMVWEDDAWHIEQGLTPDQDKLAAGGNRYTGGC
ncbi:hypothetical protein [Frigoribacterium sp. PhB24]|uniref:hypothetical protein n=1 Tax=Frigoribacterium sp. PhB24 TaxID=2485204 RepID=UPI000F4639B4|nr:hypothetical protein [Frigoribacterium sp. PhB24]ROS47927.1 hypothetical protein EDF50_3269 [Frigoribacterium sp. PhB24]